MNPIYIPEKHSYLATLCFAENKKLADSTTIRWNPKEDSEHKQY